MQYQLTYTHYLLSKMAVAALEFHEAGYAYTPGIGAQFTGPNGKPHTEIGLIRKGQRVVGVLVRVDDFFLCPVRHKRARVKDFEELQAVWVAFTTAERWQRLFRLSPAEMKEAAR